MSVVTHPLPSGTRRLRAPARREQLLDTTAQLVLDEGFGALTVEAVAQRAGVTRAVIYQHFTDLQALLETLFDRETARAEAQVDETTPIDLSGGDPTEQLSAYLGRFLEIVRDDPQTWRLVLLPPDGAPASLRARIEAGRQAVRRRLARAVQSGFDGHLDVELTARVLAATSDEYARLVLIDPERYPPARLVEHAKWWLSR